MKSKVLHTIVWKEDKLYVAKSLEIELASQGKTAQEAIKNFREALSLFLEDGSSDDLVLPRIEEISTHTVPLN